MNVITATDQQIAQLIPQLNGGEQMLALGKYHATLYSPVEHLRNEAIDLDIEITTRRAKGVPVYDLREQLRAIPRVLVWDDLYTNVVTTLGKNDILDKYLAGSAYTAAFYIGLITNTSYTAVAAGDTSSSHSGWLEGGGANAPFYSQATRPAATFGSAASGGIKATSSSSVYTIATTGGTYKGSFLTTSSTKDGTGGILFSAGTFTGGDRAVSVGDTLNVNYQLQQS
jgi:hypothetical protein